ncbi:hypothetical protein M2318_003938 [Metapseudomonas resinovorans]|uniref:hypothetical protein n=1 Tax=Metapseudomonas resinovorans TaxID=53412 RepID=UPI003D1FFF74
MNKVIDFTAKQLARAYARQDQTGEAIRCKKGSPMHQLAMADRGAVLIDGDFIDAHMQPLTEDQRGVIGTLCVCRAFAEYGYCNEGLFSYMLERFFRDVDAGIVSVPPPLAQL